MRYVNNSLTYFFSEDICITEIDLQVVQRGNKNFKIIVKSSLIFLRFIWLLSSRTNEETDFLK